MPGTPIRFGPFIGGLNTLSDPAAIEDTELVTAINMELDLDGSLISRPPISNAGTNTLFDSRLLVIGIGIFGGVPYVIGSTNNALWYYASGAWTQITTGLSSHTAVQYADKMWIIADPGSSKTSGWWVASAPTVYNEVVAIPYGYTAAVHKNRLYVSAGILDTTSVGARVFFSKATDFLTWSGAGTGSLDINPGDGQSIARLVVYNDNIMVFKQNSTYFFSFDNDPALGTLRKISGVIGATSKFCVGDYENSLYVFHRGNVYELVNTDFSRLNLRIPFDIDGTGGPYSENVFVSVLDERLIVRYYYNIYVYNLRTKTWTIWQSSNIFGPLTVLPKDLTGLEQNTYIGGSAATGVKSWYLIYPTYTSTAVETFTCTVTTKNYDLSVGHQYKRLFWWGADAASVQDIVGTVSPVVYSFTPTWNDLAPYTWDELNTWDYPLVTLATTTTPVASNSLARRRFFKFLKGLRFRQANFKIVMTTDGSSATGPVRLFTITALVSQKETVPKQVS